MQFFQGEYQVRIRSNRFTMPKQLAKILQEGPSKKLQLVENEEGYLVLSEPQKKKVIDLLEYAKTREKTYFINKPKKKSWRLYLPKAAVNFLQLEDEDTLVIVGWFDELHLMNKSVHQKILEEAMNLLEKHPSALKDLGF